jgi:hypothetical protein
MGIPYARSDDSGRISSKLIEDLIIRLRTPEVPGEESDYICSTAAALRSSKTCGMSSMHNRVGESMATSPLGS